MALLGKKGTTGIHGYLQRGISRGKAAFTPNETKRAKQVVDAFGVNVL